MTLIIDKICRFYPDATREEVQEMLSRLDPSQIKLHRPTDLFRPGPEKTEYWVASSWLTRDHLRNSDVYADYIARIDAFEQRIGAKLTKPRHTNWTFFGNLRGHRGHVTQLGFDWTDHPAAFDGGDTRHLVTQPYIDTRDPKDSLKPTLAAHWAEVMGFDDFQVLPPEQGFWNPPACFVFVLTKKRP